MLQYPRPAARALRVELGPCRAPQLPPALLPATSKRGWHKVRGMAGRWHSGSHIPGTTGPAVSQYPTLVPLPMPCSVLLFHHQPHTSSPHCTSNYKQQ